MFSEESPKKDIRVGLFAATLLGFAFVCGLGGRMIGHAKAQFEYEQLQQDKRELPIAKDFVADDWQVDQKGLSALGDLCSSFVVGSTEDVRSLHESPTCEHVSVDVLTSAVTQDKQYSDAVNAVDSLQSEITTFKAAYPNEALNDTYAGLGIGALVGAATFMSLNFGKLKK